MTSPVLHEVADRLGVYPLIDHYHEPLVAPKRHLTTGWDAVRRLPGIDLAIENQLDLLRSFRYQTELTAIGRPYCDLRTPFYGNLAYPAVDGQILHSVVRHFRPRRIIEVGSGETTRFALHALALNASEAPHHAARLTCIEPFEAAWLEGAGVDVLRSKVEDLDPETFTDLSKDDILVIDSSHVARPRGDVSYLYTEVIPLLRPGVLVHVHDIFTPRDYPRSWIERRMLWDEQYVMEALLTGNDSTEVLLATNHLYREHFKDIGAACPVADSEDREPSSFWFRVNGR